MSGNCAASLVHLSTPSSPSILMRFLKHPQLQELHCNKAADLAAPCKPHPARGVPYATQPSQNLLSAIVEQGASPVYRDKLFPIKARIANWSDEQGLYPYAVQSSVVPVQDCSVRTHVRLSCQTRRAFAVVRCFKDSRNVTTLTQALHGGLSGIRHSSETFPSLPNVVNRSMGLANK